MFTPEMKKDLSEAALTKLGAQLQSFGAVAKIDEPSVQKTGANTIIVFPVHFEKQNINARYVVNQAGLVAGKFLLPRAGPWGRAPPNKTGSLTPRARAPRDDDLEGPRA